MGGVDSPFELPLHPSHGGGCPKRSSPFDHSRPLRRSPTEQLAFTPSFIPITRTMANGPHPEIRHESAKGGCAIGLMNIPEEVLELVLQYAPFRDLKNLSLISKPLNRMVKPALFRHLDLGSHSAPDLRRLYNELFVDTSCTLAPLAGTQIARLSYRLIEEAVDEPEAAEALSIVNKILDAVGGVAVFTIELSLITEDISCFKEYLIPALNRIVSTGSSKVAHYRVWVEAYVSGPSILAAQDIIANKLDKVLAVFPDDSVSSLHVEGLSMTQLSQNLYRTLASNALKELAFRNCGDFFGLVPPTVGLRRFRLSWFGCDEVASAGLATGMRLLSVNRGTIVSLALQNLTGQAVRAPTCAKEPLILPALMHLEVVDTTMSDGSVLDHILRNTRMPRLKALDLETEDIFDFRVDTSSIPGSLEALENIELRETSMGPTSQGIFDVSAYEKLRFSCEERGIKLRTAHSSFRCDRPEDLAYEAKRMIALADTLAEVHLTCRPETLSAVTAFDPFNAPCLERIWLAVGDIISATAEHVDESSGTTQSLYDLCTWLHAPACRELHVTLFINEKSVETMILDLERLLEDRLYPRLEMISGTLMALPGMSSETLNKCESGIKRICDSLRIDCSELKYVGRKTLIPRGHSDLMDSGFIAEIGHSEEVEQQQPEHSEAADDAENMMTRLLTALDIEDGEPLPVLTGNHLRWD